MKSTIKPGDTIYNLTAQWVCKNKKRKDNVWKCTCKCGGYCYVKEKALIERIVENCGNCEENKKIIKELKNNKNYIGPKWLSKPEAKQI